VSTTTIAGGTIINRCTRNTITHETGWASTARVPQEGIGERRRRIRTTDTFGTVCWISGGCTFIDIVAMNTVTGGTVRTGAFERVSGILFACGNSSTTTTVGGTTIVRLTRVGYCTRTVIVLRALTYAGVSGFKADTVVIDHGWINTDTG